jgi:hypothetical protein
VARALWCAARGAQYAGVESLAAEALPPEEGGAGEVAGALVVANLLRGAALRVSASAAGSSPLPDVRAAAGEARAGGGFVVVLEGPSDARALALSTSPAALWAAFAGAYGGEAARLWTELLRAQPDRLLPTTRRALEQARASVRAEAAAAAAKGEAEPRTERSLAGRAAAILLLEELLWQLGEGGLGTLHTQCIVRRMTRTATAMARGAQVRAAKAPWLDLARLVEASGWPRETRSSCGYLNPCPERPEGGFDPAQRPAPAPGHKPLFDAGGLLREWAFTFGTPEEDHPIWTLLLHGHAHAPAFAPHFLAAVAASEAAGHGPLRLYREGSHLYTPHQQALGRAEVERLKEEGILWGPLTPAQERDPAYCRAITAMNLVFTGSMALTAAEEQALAARSVAPLARLARERAEGLEREVVAYLDAALHGGAPLAGAGVALAAALAGTILNVDKTRPVNAACGLGRAGWKEAGLEPGSVPRFSFTYPTTGSMLQGVRVGDLVGKLDIRDCYYSYGMAWWARAYLCQRVDLGDGRPAEVYQLTRPSMGLPDSAGVGQSISSILCLILNARLLGVLTDAGAQAMMDDFALSIHDAAHAPRVWGEVEGLLAACSLQEARRKRADFAPVNTIIGKDWDLAAGVLSLPPAKALKYLVRLALVRALLLHEREDVRAEVTQPVLASVAGSLGWWAETTATGTTHLGPLQAVVHYHHSLRDEGRRRAVTECLGWWLAEAEGGRLDGTALVDGAAGGTLNILTLDGSGHAICAVDTRRRRMAWRLLTPSEREALDGSSTASNFRELLAAEWGVDVLGEPMEGGTLAILSDATACVGPLHAGHGAGGGNAVVARIYAKLAALRIFHVAFWLPREHNGLADAGSKLRSWGEALVFCAAHGYELVSLG